MLDAAALENLEIRMLLEAVYQHYGYDFRDYAPASLKRRLHGCMAAEGVRSLSGLQERLLHDPECMERALSALTINVTAMFRDPAFYRVFRDKVVPQLKTWPSVRLWHAGCATGEEVYSMAILLTEEGLYDRCRIYATDISEKVLARAKLGLFPLTQMKAYTENYLMAGGKATFSDYYSARYDNALFSSRLTDNVVFAAHNLVTDSSFNEFHAVLCRNVLIYFNDTLQNRVHELIHQSLAPFGVLALGRKESLRFTPHERGYEVLDESERLYRKVD